MNRATATGSADRGPNPSSAAYVLFTSGTTGHPRAIVVEHTALATSCTGSHRAYTLDATARVLQFSDYAFDVSLSEILETLVFGIHGAKAVVQSVVEDGGDHEGHASDEH